MYAYKPLNMPHIGRCYYPDGIPPDDEPDVLFSKDEYIDITDGEPFWIVQTKSAIDKEVKKWGFISPYIPLLGIPPSFFKKDTRE